MFVDKTGLENTTVYTDISKMHNIKGSILFNHPHELTDEILFDVLKYRSYMTNEKYQDVRSSGFLDTAAWTLEIRPCLGIIDMEMSTDTIFAVADARTDFETLTLPGDALTPFDIHDELIHGQEESGDKHNPMHITIYRALIRGFMKYFPQFDMDENDMYPNETLEDCQFMLKRAMYNYLGCSPDFDIFFSDNLYYWIGDCFYILLGAECHGIHSSYAKGGYIPMGYRDVTNESDVHLIAACNRFEFTKFI